MLLDSCTFPLQLHASVVLSQDVFDYAPLFGEIADAYFERKMYAEAKPIYELLGADVAVRSVFEIRFMCLSPFSRLVAYTSCSKRPHACAC